jgi:hypothetical protein
VVLEGVAEPEGVMAMKVIAPVLAVKLPEELLKVMEVGEEILMLPEELEMEPALVKEPESDLRVMLLTAVIEGGEAMEPEVA